MSKEEIEIFKELTEIANTLMGPKGCPWDKEQTLVSIRGAVLEEACEVLDAIDEGDDDNLQEELGDLFYLIMFLCRIAEKEERFSLVSALTIIKEKLIFRHPHVFGEESVKDADAVLARWEELKMQEKTERESLLDGIPKALPALALAQKVVSKMKKSHYDDPPSKVTTFTSDEELGSFLYEVVKEAKEKGLHAESALRQEVARRERTFRQWEKENPCTKD